MKRFRTDCWAEKLRLHDQPDDVKRLLDRFEPLGIAAKNSCSLSRNQCVGPGPSITGTARVLRLEEEAEA